MLPGDADAALNEILATDDIAEIFVRAFRWAVRKKRYVHHHHSILTGTARGSFLYANSYKVLAGVFQNSALPQMRNRPDALLRTMLPGELAAWLRRELRTLLVRAHDEQVFPVLLALMDAIERVFCDLLWEDFYHPGRRATADAARIRGDRPFPKPVPALGGRDLSWEHVQSERGELPEYLELEQYFGRLSVSARDPSALPRALHAWSEQGDGARPWRIAVVSVLSGLGDLDWKRPAQDRRFWATAFRSPEIRAAVSGRLIRAMDICKQHRADVILIPELNTDEEIHRLLLDLLQERAPGPGTLHPMIIAGCLHEPAPLEPDAFLNRPALLTPRGQLAWGYHKVAGADWADRKEALCEQQPEIIAIDTPMGRIAVAMCLDFLTSQVLDAIVDVRASLVVVLSMTSGGSVNLFEHKAGELAASTHAVTVFCNSSVLLRPPERPDSGPCTLGFVYPHTAGAPRPLCRHELHDAEAAATVAVYELEYCSKKGLIGGIVAEEVLFSPPDPGLAAEPLMHIVEAPGPPVRAAERAAPALARD